MPNEPKLIAKIDDWKLLLHPSAPLMANRNDGATIAEFADDGGLVVTIGTFAGSFRALIPASVLERLLADRDARQAKETGP